MFDIDLFNTGKLREARYDLKEKAAQLEGMKAAMEERDREYWTVNNFLVDQAHETELQLRENINGLWDMYNASEGARKSQGEKLEKQRKELEKLTQAIERLKTDLAAARELNQKRRTEIENLEGKLKERTRERDEALLIAEAYPCEATIEEMEKQAS